MNSEILPPAPWGRSFDEYCRMFDLQPADLEKRIVGCADGPASFNAEMARRGNRMVSVDPLYRHAAAEIRRRIAESFATLIARAKENTQAFVWRDIRNPDHLGEVRLAAMNDFLDDYVAGRQAGRYICGALPDLPFAAESFDLALCAHYLFTYSDSLSRQQHVRAIVEMLRVAAEVRVFPLCEMFAGGRSRHVDGVVRQLRRAGLAAEINPVPYEFQRGGNEMLIVTRAAAHR